MNDLNENPTLHIINTPVDKTQPLNKTELRIAAHAYLALTINNPNKARWGDANLLRRINKAVRIERAKYVTATTNQPAIAESVIMMFAADTTDDRAARDMGELKAGYKVTVTSCCMNGWLSLACECGNNEFIGTTPFRVGLTGFSYVDW